MSSLKYLITILTNFTIIFQDEEKTPAAPVEEPEHAPVCEEKATSSIPLPPNTKVINVIKKNISTVSTPLEPAV